MRRDRLRLHVEDGQVVDETGRAYDVREAVDALPWQTALASSGSAHQYCVLRKSPVEAWDVLATAIAQHPDSYLAYHLGYRRPNRYWQCDGWRYWRTSSGGTGGVTHMLNRCRPDSDQLRPLEAGPADWGGGPPWLAYGSPWPPGWVNEPGPFRGGGRHGDWVYREELDTRRNYRCAGCGRRSYWHAGRPCPDCGTPASEELP
jgi:hypothetical protein